MPSERRFSRVVEKEGKSTEAAVETALPEASSSSANKIYFIFLRFKIKFI